MARGEITGRKPMVTADCAKRRPGKPRADPKAIEPTTLAEPRSSADATMPPIRGPPITAAAYSIREFCAAHRISEDMFYKMRRDGWGPATMKVGSRTLVSAEAAAEWRRKMEAATA